MIVNAAYWNLGYWPKKTVKVANVWVEIREKSDHQHNPKCTLYKVAYWEWYLILLQSFFKQIYAFNWAIRFQFNRSFSILRFLSPNLNQWLLLPIKIWISQHLVDWWTLNQLHKEANYISLLIQTWILAFLSLIHYMGKHDTIFNMVIHVKWIP